MGGGVLYAKGKRLILLSHARRRALQRRVTEDEIMVTIERPDTEGPAKSKGRRHARRAFGWKRVDVIYEERVDEITVVTVW